MSAGTGNEICAADGTEDCSACDVGYTMSAPAAAGAQTCMANVCVCLGGTAVVTGWGASEICTANGTVECSACDLGYVMSAPEGLQSCMPNVCSPNVCPNGTAIVTTGSGSKLRV